MSKYTVFVTSFCLIVSFSVFNSFSMAGVPERLPVSLQGATVRVFADTVEARDATFNGTTFNHTTNVGGFPGQGSSFFGDVKANIRVIAVTMIAQAVIQIPISLCSYFIQKALMQKQEQKDSSADSLKQEADSVDQAMEDEVISLIRQNTLLSVLEEQAGSSEKKALSEQDKEMCEKTRKKLSQMRTTYFEKMKILTEKLNAREESKHTGSSVQQAA